MASGTRPGGRQSRALAAIATLVLIVMGCSGGASATPTSSAATGASGSPALSGDPGFYAGKTIRIITGFTPGGLFDGFSRLLARHLPDHIAGRPTVIVENMPGAGSMTAANHVYNVAPRDGTVVGNFSHAMLLNQLTSTEGVEFDMERFGWLGAMASATVICLVREETGVDSLADTLPPDSREANIGSSIIYEYGLILNNALGSNLKVIPGYPGNAEVRLAIEKGEVDGYCVAWEAAKAPLQSWIDAGSPKVNIFVQFPEEGGAGHPDLADVPSIWDFTKTDEQRQLIRLLSAPERLYLPFALPPDVPSDRLAILRKAVADAMADPALRAEAEQAEWLMSPVTGEQIETTIADIFGTPDPVKDRFSSLVRAP